MLLTLLVLLFPAATASLLIIGGGTAGSVLAARLCTALPNLSITLLERAPPRTADSEFLVRSPRNVFACWQSPVTESWPSLPNPGLNGRTVDVLTGNTLGGSSAINALQWTIPVAGAWERFGVNGLTTAKARRLYRRVYRTVGFGAQPRDLRQIYADEYVRAARRAGFEKDGGPFDDGANKAMWNVRAAGDERGMRTDAYTSYLKGALDKCKNLKLMQGVTVSRLMFEGRKVSGVEYVDEDGIKFLKAKDVILSAGPYGSPKLLQLSGIGPKALLERLKIPVVTDLPVGERTQARALTGIISSYSAPLEPANNSTLANEESRRQFERGNGGVYATSVASLNGRLKKNAYVLGTFVTTGPVADDAKVVASFCFVNAFARGFLRVRSRNASDVPDVQLNLLGDQREVDGALRCLRKVRRVHEEFKGRFNVSDVAPMGAITEEFVRNSGRFSAHFVGGCRVGDVVDGELKVRGVEGLRVVDASVFGEVPQSAGVMASTYVLSEYMSGVLQRAYR